MLRLPIATRPDPVDCDSPNASTAEGTDEIIESPRSSTTFGRMSLLVRRSKFFVQHDEGTELHDHYEVESTPLGQGGFGTVWRARMRGNSHVVRAVKAVRRQSAAADVAVEDEIRILRSLDHPYICRLFETFDGRKVTYLVMELIDGVELFDYIKHAVGTLNEDLAARIMGQVFSALQYCHGKSVVHRDLKPENVMVLGTADAPRIKLIDFGLATHASNTASSHIVGTVCYTAPEARFGGEARPASDMWSAGMVLHTLVVGGLPEDAVCAGRGPLNLSDPAYAGVSTRAQELMTRLIAIDPSKRWTAAQASSSPWIREETRISASPEHLSKTMNAFTNFYRSNMLRRAVLTALAVQTAGQQITDLHEQFLLIDQDRNGRISRAELTRAISDACPGSHDDVAEWVESVFESVDTDGSDEIEYTEWVAAAQNASGARCDEAIHAAFRVFDADGSGKISVAEIARTTSETCSDILRLMPEYDLDGDGELNFEEFKALVLRAPPLLSPMVSADSLRSNRSTKSKGCNGCNAVTRSLQRWSKVASPGSEKSKEALPPSYREGPGAVRPKIIISM